MPNLTKPQEPFVGWKSPPKAPDYQEFPIYRHDGTDYRLVPENVLRKLAERKDGAFWILAGCTFTAIAALIAVMIGNRTPVQPVQFIEKPVIVEREKVVPTNCLIFCK